MFFHRDLKYNIIINKSDVSNYCHFKWFPKTAQRKYMDIFICL